MIMYFNWRYTSTCVARACELTPCFERGCSPCKFLLFLLDVFASLPYSRTYQHTHFHIYFLRTYRLRSGRKTAIRKGIEHRRLRIQYPSVSNQLLFCILQFASIFAFVITDHLPHNLPFTNALSRPTRCGVDNRASMQILLPLCEPTKWLLSVHTVTSKRG